MSNPLDPEMMSPAERLEEAASLLARGILRRWLRTARTCVPDLLSRVLKLQSIRPDGRIAASWPQWKCQAECILYWSRPVD
jgi:hypothetical protein